MSRFFPAISIENLQSMVFVDGENLAIRYGSMLKKIKDGVPAPHVLYKPDIYVWSRAFLNICYFGGVLRKYYYTSAPQDGVTPREVEGELKLAGIEAPRVFPRTKNRDSKQVDIALATEMLTHAFRKNFDIAVLITGDQDFVPLVEAVKAEGRRVYLWFIEDGLSPILKRTADHFADLGTILLNPNPSDKLR